MNLLFTAVAIAQIAAVAVMLLRGQTIRLPIAGGAATQISRSESSVAFYALVVVWTGLFALLDFLIWA
ncbi:hypothetical protein [Sphingobium sp. TCM1]|jgi:hypothetical protein|uniref:hypothetical protein n=1 Tax=Sphingobium sp. TCM1 TaxID=453246 RepID=UPI0007F367CB|nr:hypothetical protein [Sphingobium sp. TCM1]OAN54906.1 hypothetical protein A7Q26_22395 [Sphingobium sp. TCM1]